MKETKWNDTTVDAKRADGTGMDTKSKQYECR